MKGIGDKLANRLNERLKKYMEETGQTFDLTGDSLIDKTCVGGE